MIFQIFSMPDGEGGKSWDELRLGTICDALEWNYTKRFCGAGTFTLTIPRTSLFAENIEVGCMLTLTNRERGSSDMDRYEGFIVKDVLRKGDTVKLTGYDLNGLLLDRITLAETDDGKDAQSGYTETIVKHYVSANCVESEDADRNFPGLQIAMDKERGLVNDAASPRLARVADVVNDILGAAGMGYRIYPDLYWTGDARLWFDVLEETDRTDEQSENERVIFAYGLGNITEMTRETGVTADRNTFYCEYNGGYVTRYDKKTGDEEAETDGEPVPEENAEGADGDSGESGDGTEEVPRAKYSGYDRREEYLDLSCELNEVAVYAEHEVADRYRATDTLEIHAGDPSEYGTIYNVGDIVTVYDRDRDAKLNSVISAAEIKMTSAEHTVSITLGDAKPKPLDLLGKSGGAVATVVRQDVSGGVGKASAWDNTSEYFNDYSGNVAGVEGRTNLYAHAEGMRTKATGDRSHAEGSLTAASGYASHAEGNQNTASGYASHAEGSLTAASGYASHAEGWNNKAVGDQSHAEGSENTVTGDHSHAEGISNTQSERGYGVHIEGGYNTFGSGNYAHIEGMSHRGSGEYAHAEGYNNTFSGTCVHAGGFQCGIEHGDYSSTEGQFNKIRDSQGSHAEGQNNTIAEGYDHHIEGNRNEITGGGYSNHAEGQDNKITGSSYSHAQGQGNTVDTSSYNDVGGMGNNVTGGGYSIIRGMSNEVNGSQMCGVGGMNNNVSDTNWSIIHGSGLSVSGGKNKAIFGAYNEDAEDIVFAVGAGEGNDKRKNAIAVDKYGNLFLTGDIYINGVKFN